MAVLIREATGEEAERLIDMYEWLFAMPGYRPEGWDPERALGTLLEVIGSPKAVAFVAAEDDGGLLGLCTAYIDINSVRFGQRCWVEDLAVHPDHRSEGIGGRLLDAAEDWARERGATHFELDTGLARTEAQRFYERREPAAKGYGYSWRL
jgi:GNAT superfamily N-acetyltransferase